MIYALRFLRVIVSSAIAVLFGISFVIREAAKRLIPFQKLLSREIQTRRRAA